MLEKHVEYDGVEAHIKVPDEPTGLVFIAPGSEVHANTPLMNAIRDGYEERGMATVMADLEDVELIMTNPFNVYANFTDAMQRVIDGYMTDNDYTPDTFELAGHSAGGGAVLSLAKDNPVSAITVLDPVRVHTDTLLTVDSPATFIVSNYRSYKNSANRMFKELEPTGMAHAFHEMDTSKEKQSAHMFEGTERAVANIIRLQGDDEVQPDIPAAEDDLEHT